MKAAILLLTALGAFYVLNLPHFVQGGDSAEMVAAGSLGLVPHPPGYPLWMWLLHLWTRGIFFGSIFWRAALLGSVLALGALAAMGWAKRERKEALLLVIPALGLSSPFLEAALLPDVFALHALLVAGVGSLYLFAPAQSRLRLAGVPFLFFLGMANQLTTVLLAPVVAAVALEAWNRKQDRWKPLKGAAAGALLSASLYLSLLLADTQSPFSWGNLDGPVSVIRHFLRTDYGLLKLSAGGRAAPGAGLADFLARSLPELLGPLVFSCWLLRKDRSLRKLARLRIWAATCALTLGFLLVTNVDPVGMGKEILLRFHVMPLVAIALFCLLVIGARKLSEREFLIGCLLALPSFLVAGYRASHAIGLARDSVIEDYVGNLMTQAERGEPAVILSEDDNVYFALKYIQA
ncbi:MAG TPA: hypothetical protein VM598_07130, partial [Bdellovibrionota bacterium]|nr:hypothetical protein [Bdellovibrionota bacterium]